MLNDFIPNGLLPNGATPITRVLDPDRWSCAEERTAELIARIQPNQPSEERRNAVASYVQHLIMKCFSCQVFKFGSVPLKTYLPDGDIDLTAFSNNQNFEDSWAHELKYILESEEKREDAEFCVKEVQYIKAEVKIIKCLVDNIVVDISFNQLGGLCTLCFLEEVDNLISQNHLFKRSIILIKAWCYYESRILGAHHGLISTYALETLVLYIFHVYNNKFAGPLEVLYRFLEFFSKFDWDNYCLSLWGPVPLGSLPNLRAEPPRKDCGELLLSNLFLDACTSVYAVIPSSQENQEQPFISKYFNIVDPLRANNNLGRSVSKGNFFRIRSAFAFGVQQLVRLLDCPEENLITEFHLFFRNTWDRHGKGLRPDAPIYERNIRVAENSTCHESEADQTQAFHASHAVYQQHANHLKESKLMFKTSDVSAVSQSQCQKTDGIFAGSAISGAKLTNTVKNTSGDQSPNYSSHEVDAISQSVGAHSSPEFIHTSGELPPQHRIDGSSETVRGQSQSDSLINGNGNRVSFRSKVVDNHNDRVSAEIQQSLWKATYDWRKDNAVDSQNALNNCNSEFDSALIKEDDHSSDNAILMHQEEYNSLNNVETYRNHIFNGHLKAPVSVNSKHLSFPVPLPILSSGMTSNLEEITESADDNMLVADLDHGNQDGSFWSEQDVNSVRGYIYKDGNIKSRQRRVGSSFGDNHAATTKNIWLTRENSGDDPPALLSTSRNKLSSSSSLKGSLTKASKLSRDREVKAMYPTPPYSVKEGQNEGKQGPCSCPGAGDNEGLLPFAFYQYWPPLQFLNMVSLGNHLADKEVYTATSPMYMDAELHEHHSCVTLDTTTRFKKSDTFSKSNPARHGATLESLEKQRSDIFKGDFTCHWQNLQYGRLCQNAQLQGSLPYSPSSVHQLYLQEQFPWDVSGVPLGNMNIMGSGSQLVAVASTQSSFNSHQHFSDEFPRYSGGTGTYLPNPVSYKMFYRSRHYSNTRNQRGNYNYNRKDHDLERERERERERNWNSNSKARFVGRGQFRYQIERPGTRMDNINLGNRQSDWSWNSLKHRSLSSYSSHNGSFNSPMSNNHVAANVPYGMHPFPIASHGEISPSGSALPSIYMMFPCDHNVSYDSNGWPEFGYLGPAHLSGNFEGDSAESSPDQPLSPNFHRVLQD